VRQAIRGKQNRISIGTILNKGVNFEPGLHDRIIFDDLFEVSGSVKLQNGGQRSFSHQVVLVRAELEQEVQEIQFFGGPESHEVLHQLYHSHCAAFDLKNNFVFFGSAAAKKSHRISVRRPSRHWIKITKRLNYSDSLRQQIFENNTFDKPFDFRLNLCKSSYSSLT